jgi:hypothetical protein
VSSYRTPNFLITGLGNYHTVDTPFYKPLSLEVNMGQVMGGVLYLGGAGDYWLSKRENGGATETLSLFNVGAEAGFLYCKDRLYWLLSTTVFYPLIAEVLGTNGTVYRSTTGVPFSFRFRLSLGVRLNPSWALHLGAAYTLQNLGAFPEASAGSSIALTLGGLAFSGGFAFTL